MPRVRRLPFKEQTCRSVVDLNLLCQYLEVEHLARQGCLVCTYLFFVVRASVLEIKADERGRLQPWFTRNLEHPAWDILI